MGRRLISLMAALAIGTVGALVFASPSTASTSFCNFPDAPEVTSLSKAAAEDQVAEALTGFRAAKCLEVVWTDKCDGNTTVSMTNWVKDVNDWTVLVVMLQGTEYSLEGGSRPNTETVTIGPKVEDVQLELVFRGDNGWTLTVPYGDPHSWVDPGDICPTATPSATASPSPSVTATTSAPATTTSPAAPVGRSDSGGLPVTGAGVTSRIVSGIVLLVAAGFAVVLRRRRNSETVA